MLVRFLQYLEGLGHHFGMGSLFAIAPHALLDAEKAVQSRDSIHLALVCHHQVGAHRELLFRVIRLQCILDNPLLEGDVVEVVANSGIYDFRSGIGPSSRRIHKWIIRVPAFRLYLYQVNKIALLFHHISADKAVSETESRFCNVHVFLFEEFVGALKGLVVAKTTFQIVLRRNFAIDFRQFADLETTLGHGFQELVRRGLVLINWILALGITVIIGLRGAVSRNLERGLGKKNFWHLGHFVSS